ncbi:actin-domain-containing protein [Zopfochytrium polystomum]|nr:actin-domain-containing protein [Zopfochytrium polystomum]
MTHHLLRRHSIFGFEDRVVLDVGSMYLKVGLSGESKPRHIIPITVPVPAAGAIESPRGSTKPVGLYRFTLDPGQDRLTRSILLDLLLSVYNKYLLTDPKQRKVILCENPLLPLKLKRMIAAILFDILQVPSITFMPSPMLALLVTGKMTGLVIDCGHMETTVTPIYDGRPLLHLLQSAPLGGEAVTGRLKNLMKHHGSMIYEAPPGSLPPSTSSSSAHSSTSSSPGSVSITTHSIPDALIESLPADVWEDMKARTCLVGPFPSPHDVSSKNREPTFPYRDRVLPYTIYDSNAAEALWRISATDRVTVPGWVRERSAEVLFEGDEDERSIVSLVLDIILKCPTDLREPMIKNILLIGGTAMLPGFQARLAEQLGLYLEERTRYNKLRRLKQKIKFLWTVFPQNIVPWVGGSLVGALKVAGTQVSLEDFRRDRLVPDWSIPQFGQPTPPADAAEGQAQSSK